MPKKKEESVYDYNIYKIPVEKVDDFKEFLSNRMFDEIELNNNLIKDSNGFSFELMFCDKDNKKGSPWVQLLSSCCEEDLTQELKIYGAALICYNESICFVISYGNAHFYISNYCDYNFGIYVAERLINLESIRAQQNVSHGSKLNKMHIDYISGSTLSYRSGEIPTYIRGKSINPEEWGEFINCGTSAQFKWKEKPLEIGRNLKRLQLALDKQANITLPRLTELDKEQNTDKINDLYRQLAQSIENYNESAQNTDLVNVPSFYMLGTKLIQNDSIRFKLTCNGKRKEYDGELTVDAIKDFLSDKGFNIYDVIDRINISVEYSNDQWSNLKPLTDYIEFVTSDNFCLRNGKWCSFNNAYVDRILSEANKISFKNHINDEFEFDKEQLVEFAKENDIYEAGNRQPYETYYNNQLSHKLEALCIHPNAVPIDEKASGSYKLELCDLYKDGIMYFVKIGAPSNFVSAVEQAMLTLDKIENNSGKIPLPNGEIVIPELFRLLLIFDKREKIISKWSDILSINFLVRLNEIKQRINSSDINLQVDFVYNKKYEN